MGDHGDHGGIGRPTGDDIPGSYADPARLGVLSSRIGRPGLAPSSGRILVPDLEYAVQFRDFLRAINGDEVICHALGSLFDAGLQPAGCDGPVFNGKKTVYYRIETIDKVAKIYEIELVGESTELALKAPRWIERHRFFVAMGFDGDMEPHVIISDYEPMFRTTPELLPINDILFEYIGRDNDSLLEAFQERMKGSISRAIEAAFTKQLPGAR
jgi:hypothetical protein